ncbi:MAG: hypothetical protein QM733_12705 [Ilumatobacteraceae bacterium]
MSTTESITGADAPKAPSANRRALLGKGAIAAAAAATAGLVTSRTASAADGDPLNVGEDNTGTADTTLAGGSTFVVTDGTSSGFDPGDGELPASIVAGQTSSGGLALVATFTGTDEAGVGVFAASSNGIGVVARGTAGDLTADGSGKLILNQDAFDGAAPTGASVVGTLARDADGGLWYSPKDGTWVQLAGATSAGTFHVIAPARVYDSRLALPTPAPGKIVAAETRVVSVKDARNETTGAVVTADIVPAGALAVVANLTITETEGTAGGFLSVFPGDATERSGSSINWSGPDQNIANGLTAKIAADRTVKVFCGGGAVPKTHFVIDVTGYWA